MSSEANSKRRPRPMVLVALILVAAVANLNLSVANVALPDIGKHFDSSQTMLDLIAVGYSLGLAASVLYLGALGDRYGRKMMLLLGLALSVPACLLAAFAPSDAVLFGGAGARRRVGGHGLSDDPRADHGAVVGAGPHQVDRAVVGARRRDRVARARSSPARCSSSSTGARCSSSRFRWWCVAFPMAAHFVPAHVNESTEPVDNLGGVLSVVLVAALILAINFAAGARQGDLALGLAGDHPRRADRVRPPPAPRGQPALRPARRRAPGLLGRGVSRGSSCSAR